MISNNEAITLDKFNPRSYQMPLFDAIENKGYKRVLLILPRRAGKDISCLTLCARQLIQKTCLVYYVFPTYAQAKKAIWDGITIDGDKFLDYIPSSLIKRINSQEMKITLKNDSILQFVGSDKYDSLRGTNPYGVVFSEYAYQDPRIYTHVIRPILAANDGWAVFISTPFGKNHFYNLYTMALDNPDSWFALKLTLDDTKHIPLSEIEEMRKGDKDGNGRISEDMIQQEYYCSFTMGVQGSYYAAYMQQMRLESRIGNIMYENAFKVHTAWDLGVSDPSCIIFFQIVGRAIHIIDFYQKTGEGLEHYAKVLSEKSYIYGKHIAPFDINVKEFGSGMTRIDKARQLGINFTTAPGPSQVSRYDGIEAVRSNLGRMYINEQPCIQLIKALENYRQEFDVKKETYKGIPLHDWSSHASDSIRYMCISLDLIKEGSSPEQLEKNYREAMYGGSNSLPSMFNDQFRMY